MILQVPPAFVEQVIVDRAFFEDRHEFLQVALADFEAFGRNLNDRTAFHF
jgi:hypothetical protein